jgi:hypothetical protein
LDDEFLLGVARLRPRRVFRAAWWGQDLIDAMNSAPALGEQAEDPDPERVLLEANERIDARACDPTSLDCRY